MDPNNNEPICYLTDSCTLGEMLPYSPTEGVQDGVEDMQIRTRSITFESLYENIASLPHTVDITNKKLVVKKYYITTDRIITITVDQMKPYRILTKISGDGIEGTMVKTSVKKDNVYYVTYHVE